MSEAFQEVQSLGAGGISLILADREPGVEREFLGWVIVEKQAAGSGEFHDASQVDVAEVAGESAPAGHVKARLNAPNSAAAERHGEADSRVDQQIVVLHIANIAEEVAPG